MKKQMTKMIAVGLLALGAGNPAYALKWELAGWCRSYSTLTNEVVTDFIEAGEAQALTIGDVKQGKVASVGTKETFEFLPDSEYEVSAWMKCDGVGRGILGVNSHAKGYRHYYRNVNFNLDTQWRRVGFKVKTPSVKRYDVFKLGVTKGTFGIAGGFAGRTVWMRDWTLRRIEPKASDAGNDKAAAKGWNGNNVFNSSFEMGIVGHGVMSYMDYAYGAKPAAWSIDETSAVHGRRSLKIDNTQADTFIEYMTKENAIVPGEPFTYSIWMKADRPTTVRLWMLDHKSPGDKWRGSGEAVDVTTEWKRYAVTGRFDAPNEHVTLQVELRDPGVLWIDAVQLEMGERPGDYKVSAPVEAGFEIDANHVSLKDAPLDAKLTVAKYTPGREAVKVKGSLDEYDFDLGEGESASKTVKLPTGRYGVFTIGGRVACGGYTGEALAVDYGVVADLGKPKKEGFYLGLNSCERAFHLRHGRAGYKGFDTYRFKTDGRFTIDEHFRNMRLHGCAVMRLHDGSARWNVIEPVKGEYHWEGLDTIVAACEKQNLKPMFILGNGACSGPVDSPLKDWYVRRNSKKWSDRFLWGKSVSWLPDKGDWETFLTALVKRYGDRLIYEVINEPNLVMPSAQEYFKYLKLSYETIKRHAPNAKVVGICATGDFGGKVGEYIDEVGRLGGFQYMDVMSFHPYDSTMDTSPKPAEDGVKTVMDIVAKYRKGIPVEQNEAYYLTPDPYALEDATMRGVFPATYLTRRALIDLNGGLAGSLSLTGSHIERADAGHRGVERNPVRFGLYYNPNGHFIAGNALARFAEGATAMGKVRLPGNLNGFAFRAEDGRECAAIWVKENGVEKFMLTKPQGVRAFDLFGNEIAANEITLDENTVYFVGEGVKGKLEKCEITRRLPIELVELAETVKDGKKGVCAKLKNASGEEMRVDVRLEGCADRRMVVLKAGESSNVFFETDAKPGRLFAAFDGRVWVLRER